MMGYLETFRADDSSPIAIDTRAVTGWWQTMDNVTAVRFDGTAIEVLMPFEDVSMKLKPRRSKRTDRDPEFRNRIDGQHFHELWSVYPRKEGKQAAIRAWGSTQHCRPALPILLEAVAQGKRCEQWQDLSKVPHLSTWINNRRWEDQVVALNGQSVPSVHEVLEGMNDVRSTFRVVGPGERL